MLRAVALCPFHVRLHWKLRWYKCNCTSARSQKWTVKQGTSYYTDSETSRAIRTRWHDVRHHKDVLSCSASKHTLWFEVVTTCDTDNLAKLLYVKFVHLFTGSSNSMLISTQVSGEVNTVCSNVGKEVMLQKSQDEAHSDKCKKKSTISYSFVASKIFLQIHILKSLHYFHDTAKWRSNIFWLTYFILWPLLPVKHPQNQAETFLNPNLNNESGDRTVYPVVWIHVCAS